MPNKEKYLCKQVPCKCLHSKESVATLNRGQDQCFSKSPELWRAPEYRLVTVPGILGIHSHQHLDKGNLHRMALIVIFVYCKAPS
jgi:hypothetical protein